MRHGCGQTALPLSTRAPQLALIVVGELVALVVLLVFVAYVVIPLAAPTTALPTPTIPPGALRDCPRVAPGCR